jgi:hypothetical protein
MIFIIIFGGIIVLFLYITRLALNEIFSPSNKIHWEVGRAKNFSAPRYSTIRYRETQNTTYIFLLSRASSYEKYKKKVGQANC